jgi:hypothetical protein
MHDSIAVTEKVVIVYVCAVLLLNMNASLHTVRIVYRTLTSVMDTVRFACLGQNKGAVSAFDNTLCEGIVRLCVCIQCCCC